MKLTPNLWAQRFAEGTAHQIFLDGKDVTRGCAYADDEAGEVHFFDYSPEGNILLDAKGDPIRIVKTGQIEIRSLPRREWDLAYADG